MSNNMIPLNILKKRNVHIDKLNKYIYLGHFKAGFSSSVHILKDRSIRPLHKNKYKSIELTQNQYENIFKFSIVRNPYDRVLSAFYFLQRRNQGKIPKGTDFKKWIKEVFKIKGYSFNNHFKPMYSRMVYNDTIWLDYIAKLENIENDWKYIADKCDLNPVFPCKNNSYIKRSRFDHYDDECIEMVYNIYKNDIDKLGYSFGDN